MIIDGDDSRQQQQQQRRRRRDEIFALHRKLRKNKADSDGDGGNGGDGDIDAAGEIIITPYVLETTVVPAMKDLLQNEDLKREITIRSSLRDEEKKDNIGDGIDVDKDKDDDDDVQFTIAILDCLISFLTSNDNQSSSSSSSQRSATTNSLSFRAGNRSPSKSSSIKEIKTLFVTSGAYEMIMHLLRQILDDHCNQASSKSWQTTAKSDIGTDMDNIGIGIGIDFDHMDNGCDLKIESCLPSNQIPVKIMKLIALLANNSSDTIKNDHLLIHLNTIIHKSMMIYCPCSQIQGYGCWILYSLSNPLLQELIAAGSFSLLVQAMKCHPCSKKVQEYGNKALYNLLPLLVLCYNQNQINNSPPKSKSKSSSSSDSPPPAMKMNGMMKKSIEIDGKQLEDYESLLPSLSAIVLRGMEYHYPYQLSVQQYGLLVLMRLCQHDQEQYEIIVSEGGLTALLNIIKMTTTDTYSALSSMNTSDSDDDDDDNDDDDHSVHDQRSIKDKYESLAQMACQFLRDLSRPTNSSLDILRIIAVKGGIQTVLDLLDYYNANDESSQQGSSSVINIIDPAMACLRNLMVHEDNRTEVVTKSLSIDSAKKDGIIPIVLKIMNAHRYDAAIQAYGCDLLGRIASNEELGRIILIQTTINNNDNNNIGIGIGNGNGNGNGNNNEDNNNTVNNNKSSPTGSTAADAMKPRSRFWNSRNNKASSTSETTTTTTTTTTTKNNTPEDADADEEIINLSDQFNNSSSISNGSAIMTTSSSTTSMDSIDMNSTNTGNNDSIINNNIKEPKPKLTRNSNSDDDVDSFITIIRAMKTHRMHHGVQQRAIILLLALVVDKDNNNLNNNNNSMNSSSYLIQRLQEVYYDIQHQEEVAEEVPNNMSGNNRQQKENNNTTFISFLKTTSVTSKGLDRLQKLIKIVEQYECMKQKQQGIGIGIGIGGPTNTNTATATASSMVTNLFRGWGA